MHSPKLRQEPGRHAAPGFSLRGRACGRARRVSRVCKKKGKYRRSQPFRFRKGKAEIRPGGPGGPLKGERGRAKGLLAAGVESSAEKLIERGGGGDRRPLGVCRAGLVRVINPPPIAVELPPIEKAADSVEAAA